MRVRSIRRILPALLTALLAAGLLLQPEGAGQAAREGLALCAQTVLPALFPFFILSGLVVELGYARSLGRLLSPVMEPLFGVGGAGSAALLLGLVGGYPTGARTAGALYRNGQLNRQEAQRLLLFCNNAGPAFLLAVVGTETLHSTAAGVVLLVTHVLGGLGVGLLSPLLTERPPVISRAHAEQDTPLPFSAALTKVLGAAVQSCLNVCACVVLFAVVLALVRSCGALEVLLKPLEVLGISGTLARPLVTGLVELTNGVTALPPELSAPVLGIAAFLMGFGGLSVLCQTEAVLEGTELSCKWCALGQMLHGLLSAGLVLMWMRLFPDTVSAMVNAAVPISPASSLLPMLAGRAAWGAGVGLCGYHWLKAHFSRKHGKKGGNFTNDAV